MRDKPVFGVMCSLCGKAVSLEECKTDRDGRSVHERCYIDHVCTLLPLSCAVHIAGSETNFARCWSALRAGSSATAAVIMRCPWTRSSDVLVRSAMLLSPPGFLIHGRKHAF